MRKTLIGAVLLTVNLLSFSWADSPQKPLDSKEAALTPAAESSPLPPTLPAEMFQGRVREAYQVAADIPEVLAGVSCYCGCSKSHGHRYLLDCFVDGHGNGCEHCVDEALDAHALFMTGTPLEEIRKFIDNKYGPKR